MFTGEYARRRGCFTVVFVYAEWLQTASVLAGVRQCLHKWINLRASSSRREDCAGPKDRLWVDLVANLYQIAVLFWFLSVYRVPIDKSTGTSYPDWHKTRSHGYKSSKFGKLRKTRSSCIVNSRLPCYGRRAWTGVVS